MSITGNGNVGINITSSTSKLCINPNVIDNGNFDFTTMIHYLTHVISNNSNGEKWTKIALVLAAKKSLM
jgi:hypothetical protein